MKTLKWIGIGFGGLAGLIGAVIAVVFLLTAGAASAADEFLTLVGQNKHEEAYRSTAPQFQAETNLDAFRATMQRYGVDKFQSASWTTREISGATSVLKGTIKTTDGRTLVVTMQLVKIGDKWKVHGMTLRPAGVS